jgi:hypothetical protein
MIGDKNPNGIEYCAEKGCQALNDDTGARHRRHGAAPKKTSARQPLYNKLGKAKGRCRNPNDRAYSRYGGRGVIFDRRIERYEDFLQICPRPAHPDASPELYVREKTVELANSVRLFYVECPDAQTLVDFVTWKDRGGMNQRYWLQWSIDRILNELGYEPGNIRLVPNKYQAANRTICHTLSNGRFLSDQALLAGIDPRTAASRRRKGRDEDTLLNPITGTANAAVEAYALELLWTGALTVHRCGRVIVSPNKPLIPSKASGGYLSLKLPRPRSSGHVLTHTLIPHHRLVALALLPPPGDGQLVIDHRNRIRADNRAENLRWASFLENAQNRRQINADDRRAAEDCLRAYQDRNTYSALLQHHRPQLVTHVEPAAAREGKETQLLLDTAIATQCLPIVASDNPSSGADLAEALIRAPANNAALSAAGEVTIEVRMKNALRRIPLRDAGATHLAYIVPPGSTWQSARRQEIRELFPDRERDRPIAPVDRFAGSLAAKIPAVARLVIAPNPWTVSANAHSWCDVYCRHAEAGCSSPPLRRLVHTLDAEPICDACRAQERRNNLRSAS